METAENHNVNHKCLPLYLDQDKNDHGRAHGF